MNGIRNEQMQKLREGNHMDQDCEREEDAMRRGRDPLQAGQERRADACDKRRQYGPGDTGQRLGADRIHFALRDMSDREQMEEVNEMSMRTFDEETVKKIVEAAKELLEKYREERKKQIVAMRMASRSAAERQEIQRRKYAVEKEIREYEKIFRTVE